MNEDESDNITNGLNAYNQFNLRQELEDFVRTEIEDGVLFEEILERFDLTPEEVFVFLFLNGQIDEEVLENYLTDI